MNTTIKTVDDYINNFSSEIQEKLNTIRKIILDNAPNVVESISYGMPAYKTHKKPLVYFGGFKNHVGFYATPTGHETFAEALKPYKKGKGSVQFPLNTPIPIGLITRMVKFRVNENIEKFNTN